MKKHCDSNSKTPDDDLKPQKKGKWSLLEVVLLVVIVFIVCIIFSVPVRRHFEEKKTSLYRMGVLHEVLCDYAKAHNGQLPPAEVWCDELMKFDKTISKEMFRDGHDSDTSPCHISFNTNMSNAKLNSLSSKTVILFGARGAWNLNGSEVLVKDIATTPILYANGITLYCCKENGAYRGIGGDSINQYELEWQQPEK